MSCKPVKTSTFLQEKYTHKKDLFFRVLDSIGIQHTIPEGAYYVLIDISKFDYESDFEFAEVLTRDVGVVSVHGSLFFKENENQYGRFHFVKKKTKR